MTVRIRETAYQTASGATYQVRSDEVRGHLMIIASGGSGNLEPSFGDDPDPNDADYSIVAFNPNPAPDPATPAGRVRARLKALVDQGDDNQIIGVPGDTVWSDGSTVESQTAFTLGNTVFYDTSNCNGDGRWFRGENGEEECAQSVVILYHELAHAFRNHGAGDLATEEAEAIDDENDLHEALGIERRDRNRIEGGCGCPDGGCCIVASVAYGSPFAPEINALRHLRDYTLRSSRLGAALFDAIHREYYGFSVEVCRIMVQERSARTNVETWLVRPLAGILGVIADYTSHADDRARAGARLLHHLYECRNALGNPDWPQIRWLLQSLCGGHAPLLASLRLDAGTRAVCNLLARSLPDAPHVRWGIVGPLLLHAEAAERFAGISDALAAGAWLDERAQQWLAEMPLHEIPGGVSPQRMAAELDAIAASVFAEPDHRREFAARLMQSVSGAH